MRSAVVFGCCLAVMTMFPVAGWAEEAPAEDAPAEEMSDIGFQARAGVVVPTFMSPNFFGFGAAVDNLVTIGDDIGVGLRIVATALYGMDLDGQDVSAGVRGLGAVLAKGEYTLGSGGVQPMAGLSAGFFTVMVMGADVGGEDVGAVAGGGQAFGLEPQLGVDLGNFRIAAVSQLIFAGSHFEPIFGLELSGIVRSFEF